MSNVSTVSREIPDDWLSLCFHENCCYTSYISSTGSIFIPTFCMNFCPCIWFSSMWFFSQVDTQNSEQRNSAHFCWPFQYCRFAIFAQKKKMQKNSNWISRQQHQHYLNICIHSARDRFWTICYEAITIYLSIVSNRRATKLGHIDVIAFDPKKPTWICNEKLRRNCLSRSLCVGNEIWPRKTKAKWLNCLTAQCFLCDHKYS